jgi:hypothetical protein
MENEKEPKKREGEGHSLQPNPECPNVPLAICPLPFSIVSYTPFVVVG